MSSKITSNHLFSVGFIFGIGFFICASVSRYIVGLNNSDYRILGFPITFLMHRVGPCNFSPCDDFRENEIIHIYYRFLFIDIFIALFFSLILGFIFRFVWLKITTRKLK